VPALRAVMEIPGDPPNVIFETPDPSACPTAIQNNDWHEMQEIDGLIKHWRTQYLTGVCSIEVA